MFCAFPSPRYQVSVYRTNGPLITICFQYFSGQGNAASTSSLEAILVTGSENKGMTLYEPRSEKTGLRGFRPGPIQTGLYCHGRYLEA